VVTPDELAKYDGSYEDMKDRIPQEFDGVWLKGELERSTFNETALVLHSHIHPFDVWGACRRNGSAWQRSAVP